MTKSILIYGRDGTLVETRRRVLASNGISSGTATDRSRVEQFLAATPTELLVVCSSLDADEQESVTQFAHREASGAKCLVVIKSAGRMPQLHSEVAQVEAMAGPEIRARSAAAHL